MNIVSIENLNCFFFINHKIWCLRYTEIHQNSPIKAQNPSRV